MKPELNLIKKSAVLLSSLVLVATFNASAQKKSVYDVIPGSGPQKKEANKNVDIYGSRKRDSRRNTYPIFTTRKRKNLPPGQAKKIYGGSAKDYAPGQLKKHHHERGWHEENGERGRDREYGEREHSEKDHDRGHGKRH